MKRHGLSHGAAVLVCSVSSALLVDMIRNHVPTVYDAVNRFSTFLIDWSGVAISPLHFTTIVYASTMAVIWGVAFALVHED